jgi:hypothetical protein
MCELFRSTKKRLFANTPKDVTDLARVRNKGTKQKYSPIMSIKDCECVPNKSLMSENVVTLFPWSVYRVGSLDQSETIYAENAEKALEMWMTLHSNQIDWDTQIVCLKIRRRFCVTEWVAVIVDGKVQNWDSF